ncbi:MULTISPECIES: hypothetical protein [unclassified Lysinibacillus]|uniref:hypothetical protein n=1 Tax=unclassified Lysinibacillus TaxID=2636778 RepID=UPI002556EA20|nr:MULTISPECIES: hypothetical protein [unclassified Lysinibacillus]MDM5246525.1 hypothetical protein [Lysinibacillus sp. G4S2]
MNIQLGNSNYLSTLKKDGSNRLSDDLFLDKNKKSKATYEIKKEKGYIRHYVTKANGEIVMIKETKLPKSKENEQSSGDMKDMITEMVMNQLTKILDKEQFNKFSKTGLVAQKEKQIEKYATSI